MDSSREIPAGSSTDGSATELVRDLWDPSPQRSPPRTHLDDDHWQNAKLRSIEPLIRLYVCMCLTFAATRPGSTQRIQNIDCDRTKERIQQSGSDPSCIVHRRRIVVLHWRRSKHRSVGQKLCDHPSKLCSDIIIINLSKIFILNIYIYSLL
jgi:hypothetical protein